MVVTVTPVNYLQLGACDALSDISGTWSGNSAGTESDFYKEGIGCLGFTIRTVGNNDILYTKTSGTWDLSGVKHLRLWFLCSTPNAINVDDPGDPANAGIQFFVGDAVNTAYYKVGGKTSYPGGWYNLVVDLSRAADTGTKPTGMLCTRIGLRMNMTAAPKNVDNVWIDNLVHCDGLTCYGDDAGAPFDFQDIYDKDNATTGAWGIIRKISGVYYLTGSLKFGDSGGSNNCTFQDINQVVVFEDRKVYTGLYEIAVVMGGGTTKFYLGDAGISGCTVKSISTVTPFKITATATITELGLYGSTFDTHGVIDLAPAAANREALNNSFSNGQGQIQPNTMVFQNNNVVSNIDAGGAILFESASHSISYNNYINNSRATEFPTAGGYTITGDQFNGNTYDVHFSALSGNLVIDTAGSPRANPSEGKVLNDSSGSVTINQSVAITITVKTVGGTPIQYARVLLLADTGGSYPFEEPVSITRSESVATVSHAGHGLKTDEMVLISGAEQQEYNGIHTITYVGVDSYSYTVSGTPATPATGTITSTFVLLSDETNSSGIVADSIRYLGTQPFIGRVRKGSSSPYYQTGYLSGSTVNADYSATVLLVQDE